MYIVIGWLLRALSRGLQSRFPVTAAAIGIGNEPNVALSAKPADLIGRTGRVEIAIEAGRGRVKVVGVSWPAEGDGVPIGNAVRIIRVDGNRLSIERICPWRRLKRISLFDDVRSLMAQGRRTLTFRC